MSSQSERPGQERHGGPRREDRKACGHRSELFNQVWIRDEWSKDRRQVEQPEHTTDRNGRVVDHTSNPHAENRDKHQIHSTTGQALHTSAGDKPHHSKHSPSPRHSNRDHTGLSSHHTGPAGHRSERRVDEARAVLTTDDQHTQHRHRRLSGIHTAKQHLGATRGRGRAHSSSQRNGDDHGQPQQPSRTRRRTQLGPLGPHTSLRRSRTAAVPRATAVYPHNTANPAHGASG